MYHTILNTTKGLYGFGYNDYEQLGLCDIKSANLPIKLKFFNDMEIVSVSCGGYHTIVNTINGLFVFGSNEYGQLGLGYSDFNICVPTKIDSLIEEDCCPKYIERVYLDVVEIVSVSCGENHTIIRTTDGLYSCGHNDFGQLGLGDVGDKNIPMKLEFFNSLEIISISCGADHTLINTNDGLYGFGDNSYEQLGLKDTLYAYVPTKLEFEYEIISINCGGNHTIVNTLDGLFVFGYNKYGQLGLGDSEYATVPTKSDFFKVSVFEIISISCGNIHTVVHTTNGLYVFGGNAFGQLGLGDNNKREIPEKLSFFDNYSIISVSCGLAHTVVNTNEYLYVFGNNVCGQLGLGRTNALGCVNVPICLNFFNNFEIISISCGPNKTTVNTTDGLYVFGSNYFGQLGLGDTEDRVIPTKLDFFDSHEIISILCNGESVMINTTNGLYVFGSNDYGQLGLGYTNLVTLPTKLNFDFEVIGENQHKRIKSARSKE